MVKTALMAGAALTLVGVIGLSWPAASVAERSRRLVETRTYDRRGPSVTVHAGAERVRDASGQALSVTMLLGADGYWVRARAEYLTRERLTGTKILVVDRAWDTIGGRRTRTLLSRWIHEGGAVLMLARGEGAEARHQLGTGRIAVVDPAAFNTTGFVTRLLDAIHWLSPSIAD